MPVSYRHLTGTNRISEEYGIINENFDDVADDINAINTDTGNLQQDVQAAQQTADTAITKADAAQQTADTGVTNAAAAQTSANQAQATADQGITAAGAAQAAADAAQQDLDVHKADKVAHLSSTEHDKLTGIQSGAEKNQNAFAKVNDLDAANPSDSLTIKAGPGIAVTTNPNSKEVEITATGTSTPGPHASSHLEHGSDPIPDATPTTGGLMSAADKTKLDKLKLPPWTWQDLEGGI